MNVEVDRESVREFSADLKKYGKKYRHLKSDLGVALKVLKSDPVNPRRSPQIPKMGDLDLPVFKLRKFHSSDMKNKRDKNGFRLIYAYSKEENRIILIEFYHKNKNEKKDCDRERIKRYFGS